MKKARYILLISLCLIAVLAIAACVTDNEVPAHEHIVPYEKTIIDWGKNMEYLCTKCNQKVSTPINGKLVLTDPEAKDGYTFIGWKVGDCIYTSNQEISVFGGEEVSPVYDNGENHICAYVKSAESTEPTCSVIGKYHLTCSCGNVLKKIVPAHGHMWTTWSKTDDSEIYARKCEVCGITENKKLINTVDGGELYAFGDSITFGQKVGGINASYAKFVAEELGMDYYNDAFSGSEAYQWYSLLTQKPAPNGKETSNINGLTSEKFRSSIESADVIIFSLGTNDIFYTEWRPVAKIKEVLENIVDSIHVINPNAKVIIVGGAYSEQFWDGGKYDKDQKRIAELTESLAELFEKEKYNEYAYFVDMTRILSDHNSYIDVSYGSPDGIHPGFKANKYMADFILDAVLKK